MLSPKTVERKLRDMKSRLEALEDLDCDLERLEIGTDLSSWSRIEEAFVELRHEISEEIDAIQDEITDIEEEYQEDDDE